jgi:UDP-3-O-[3-hydroxymyristoyl] glucosamine N-acyltransferase
MRLSELADQVGGELHGDGDLEIRGVAGIRDAREGDLTFLGHPRYENFLKTTRATAVIMERANGLTGHTAVIENANPYLAFQKAMQILYGDRYLPPRGVHPTAVVDPGAEIGEDVSIGPFVVIEAGARIGDGCVVRAGVYVGAETSIGARTQIYPNVVIRERVEIGCDNILHAGAVIGDDGFGFARDGAEHRKIPQIGRVVLGDNVEVGSNTCIDRATIGETYVGAGARIDNLVQIGHNVRVEENAVICAQVGIAGSSKIGKRVMAGGQAGISGHIEIGDDAEVGAQAGVIGNVEPGERVSGYPARPHSEQLRTIAASRRLPELLRKIERLERRLAALERESSSSEKR